MKYLNLISITTFVLTVWCFVGQIDGHGMMLSPVGRSSRWRYDSTAPKNYDDNGLYCGGFWVCAKLILLPLTVSRDFLYRSKLKTVVDVVCVVMIIV